MIRLIHCMKRKPGVSVEEFRSFWVNSEFSKLVDELTLVTEASEVRRHLTLFVDANHQLQQERNAREPFDAVVEIIWDSAQKVGDLGVSKDILALSTRLTELQRDLIDFEESRRFFTDY